MPDSPLRLPAVAGTFYADDPATLERDVRALLAAESEGERAPCIAVVAPHAGYLYSGHVAAATYARVVVPRRVIILAVNHHGRGADVASWSSGAWRTPLGDLEVDRELVEAIARHADFVVHDPAAHSREHSLEVQLPFLALAAETRPRFAPISIATHDLGRLQALGRAVAAAVREAAEPVLIVSSTDMTHYEEGAFARRQDELALARVEAVDGPGLLAVVRERGISMCGVAPTTAALIAASELGATHARLVRYANSGDITGDQARVVGYAGLTVA